MGRDAVKTIKEDIPNTLGNLENFFMIGQWASVGGSVPPALLSGRYPIQVFCEKDKREFVVSTPSS